MSSDSEVEEIKIEDVKKTLQKKEQELQEVNKKKRRTKTKPIKNLLDKFKDEINKDIAVSTKSHLELFKQKKVKNVKTFDDDEDEIVYEK